MSLYPCVSALPPASSDQVAACARVLMLDHDGTIMAANPPALAFFAPASPDVLGISWGTLGPLVGIHTPTLADLHALTTTQSWYHCAIRAPNCSLRWQDISAHLVYRTVPDLRTDTHSYVLSFVDSTTRLVHEGHIRIQERHTTRRAILGHIAHTINSPLQVVLNVLTLAEQAEEPERQQLLALAQQEIERIGRTLHQMDHHAQGEADDDPGLSACGRR